MLRHGMYIRKLTIYFATCIRMTTCVMEDIMVCHDNFNLNPPDGTLQENTFNWLGFLQYVHVTRAEPHRNKAPRVVLIQKQFVIGTAHDMLHLPKNYKVGNVIFGQYEREEDQCGITQAQIKMGVTCARAYIEIPLAEITPHPEYSRFGVGNSLALVRLIRPLKSHYMVPICLPSIGDRERKRKTKTVFMVDYISTVPRDFETEMMGKKTLKLYTHKECSRHRMRSRLGSEGVTHVLCSSGCGMRAGAPIVSHTLSGMFEVVGLAAGGAPCGRRSMRRRLNSEPPLYIDVFPYVAWVSNVISAHILPLPYPHNFKLTDADGASSVGIPGRDHLKDKKKQRAGWKGRMYVTGNWCYKPETKQRKAVVFYSEKFEAIANPPAKLHLFMKISAGFETTIVCARLILPNRLSVPVIDGVGGYNISIKFTTQWFPDTFYFYIALAGIPMITCALRNMMECHDNFNLNPTDGILKDKTFTWLGFVQYIHVTTGLPHHSKAPRVVLIQKQFVIGTATDMLHLPKNYKVGNVVFGDYDRDEEDCELTLSQIKMGVKCARAYLEMPISEITPHPEFSRFGVGNSLALIRLIRPLKSHYMIPICMPSTGDRETKRKTKMVFMVDYITPVPRDFETEKMGKKTLKLYTHKECRRHRMRSRLGSEGVTHVLCSSGCGMRAGAPIVSHTLSGMFEVVGLAAGGAPCGRRSMRRRLNSEPPLYIDVFPYVAWVSNVISAHILPLPYPHNFKLTDADGASSVNMPRRDYLRARKRQKAGWKARMYVSGNFCYKSEKKQRKGILFYSERFEVNADPPAKLNMFMKISAGFQSTIVCARLLMPNRLATPTILGVGGYNISIQFNTQWFPYVYYFSLGLTSRNTSAKDWWPFLHERSPGFW